MDYIRCYKCVIHQLSMKQLYKAYKTLRPEIKRLFWLSFGLYLLNIALFDRFPELYPGFHLIGIIVTNITLALVSSSIFYFLVIHLKQERDKRNCILTHNNSYRVLIERHQGFLRDLKDVISIKEDFSTISKIKLEEALKKVHTETNFGHNNLTLRAYINEYDEIIARVEKSIYSYPNLNTDIFSLVYISGQSPLLKLKLLAIHGGNLSGIVNEIIDQEYRISKLENMYKLYTQN